MSSPRLPSAPLDDEQLEEQLNWLDQLRADAGVPETVNTEDAVLVHFNVCDETVSVHTYRRWPIDCFVMGRERRYYLTDVIAFAKKRFEEASAVRRPPPQTPRKKRIRPATTQSPPTATHKRESVGQRQETETETAL
jgi:hypothetical protein